MLTISSVVDACNMGIGKLGAMVKDAELREATIAGRIAPIFRFPADLREAIGTQHKVVANGAFGIAFLVQYVVVPLLVATLTVWGAIKAAEIQSNDKPPTTTTTNTLTPTTTTPPPTPKP
jgi:hypothetical protein